ncbi:hypothetical protein SA126VB_29 [Escherichia phage vB_EcoS_SA126VB]|nr:hypothetical protein SA126VB_29 [Escherichia phage vB_EcoS_SA126VB]
MCGNTNRCCLGSPATQAGILQGQLAQAACNCKTFQPVPVTPVFVNAVAPAIFKPFDLYPYGSFFRIF